nr:MAG TPA: hypothetical protein [Caudoviricetes sp.]
MNSVGSNTEGKLNCINAVVITHNNKSRQQTGLQPVEKVCLSSHAKAGFFV